jgi:hypothetical protein
MGSLSAFALPVVKEYMLDGFIVLYASFKALLA